MQSRLYTHHVKNVKNKPGKNVRESEPSVLWEAGYEMLEAHVCSHVSAHCKSNLQPAGTQENW